MDEYIKAQTTCSICLDIMKDPKALSCLHTFCGGCIKNVIKKTRITCPYCASKSAVKDIKDDFKVKELIDIRLKRDEAASYTAKNQVQDQLNSLKFLKRRYLIRLDQITAANQVLQSERIRQLRAYKRKWIDAFELECEIAEAETLNCTQTDGVTKKIKRRIADIDAAAAKVEEMQEQSSVGAATVKQTHRFSEELAKLTRYFPPRVASTKLQKMSILSCSDAEISAQAHSCFTEYSAAETVDDSRLSPQRWVICRAETCPENWIRSV